MKLWQCIKICSGHYGLICPGAARMLQTFARRTLFAFSLWAASACGFTL